MGHKVIAVQSPKPGQGATVEVSDETKQEIEELFKYLTENPGTEGFVEFDKAEEVAPWIKEVRSYAATREAGALKFRQLPSKHLPDTQVRFQLTRDLPADGARKTSGKNKAA